MLVEKNKKSNLIALGVIMCVIGIYLLSNNYLNEKVDKAYNNMNLQLLAMNDVDLKELDENEEVENNNTEQLSTSSDNKPSTSQTVNNNTNNNNNSSNNKPSKPQEDMYAKYYVAKLSIPKINLQKGLVGIDSQYNTVTKNIQIIKGSNYPDVSNGNLILASHAGTNSVSYFRNLYKLVKGDKCYVTYNGKTYTYQIVNIYTKPKTGQIAIYRNYDKTNLTLITCTRGSNTKQTVYIAELINVE